MAKEVISDNNNYYIPLIENIRPNLLHARSCYTYVNKTFLLWVMELNFLII